MTRLEAGDAAPAFALSDQHGATVRLDDFRGRKLLVYFYPEADTPGCTTQSCDVRDHRRELAALGIDVVGISPDEPADQLAFDRKFSLGFPLLADPDHAIAEAWGTWGEKNVYGKRLGARPASPRASASRDERPAIGPGRVPPTQVSRLGKPAPSRATTRPIEG